MRTLRPLLVSSLAAGLLGTLALQAPASGAEPAAAAPDPIVFVHGWNSSGSTWGTMAGRFKADGWPASHLDQWTYNTSQSNATTASQLSTEIDRLLAATGATKVDVVTHSMGGLSSRYYTKNLGGAAKVDAWISLGGPNHGTDTAYFCGGASCTEMRPGSSFLNALNSGDETPGAPRYATWWSACDSVINPDSSVPLTGATNTQTACLSHGELRTDATVYGQVKSFVG
ncbi:triacylglycerol lipase [Streptomyces sp. ISL-100]|uniref:esterase/lipase family protein n=1 Tax=Streptomyces sp. ISL-100 TaxID=2819173 RepID=UPI001BEC7271|nr:triacylglycerol lipase [Streptomyces sp. ISL-100]MBT2395400.1 triacylglycerol lipase [Streptomyces sp. ISL-100]